MTVTTVYSSTADGSVYSTNATYATARTGGTLTAFPSTQLPGIEIGQYLFFGTYYCAESFFSFDTSPVPDGESVTAVGMSVYNPGSDKSDTDFLIEARISNWGATLTTADFVSGASLSGLTRVATFNTSGWTPSAGYVALAEDGTNFQAAIDKAGTTYVMLSSDRHRSATAPVGAEYVDVYFADGAGTTQDPKLVITSVATPSLAVPKRTPVRMMQRF